MNGHFSCSAKVSPLEARCWIGATLVVLVAVQSRGATAVDFQNDVVPIIEQHCIRCHEPGNKKGDISLATMSDLAANEYVVAGSPDDSYLLDLVTAPASGKSPAMPKQGRPLSADEIAVLRRWIAEGAVWPASNVVRPRAKADKKWWSLQPLRTADPPRTDDLPEAWRDHAIDRFVCAGLQERGLLPSPPADKRTLIRRVTYDLTGLPPTPAEVAAFLADDSPGAYEQLVDRLLDSPHYGQQWGRHWLDVVRFGESTGFERNIVIDNAWPFRDYVIRSLNADRPFDRMVIEHVAGGVIEPGDPQVEVGTTFLVCGPYDNVGNQDPAQAAIIRANTIDEMIRAVSESFLGITVGCARCHDHKFDPVLQSDYYSLYATLAGVEHGSRVIATPEMHRQRNERLQPLTDARQRLADERAALKRAVLARAEANKEKREQRWTRPRVSRFGTEEEFAPVEARFVRLDVINRENNADARSGYNIDELEVWTAGDRPRNVALAAAGATAEGASRVAEDFGDAYTAGVTIDGRFGVRWIAAGPQLTIRLAQPESIGRIVFSSDRPRALGPQHGQTAFVGDYRIEVSLDGTAWTEVANSLDRAPPSPAHRLARLMESAITEAERSRLAEIAAALTGVERELAAIPPLPAWWVGNFRQPTETHHIFLGGDPQRRGDAVTAASPALLNDVFAGYRLPADASEGQRRLRLAEWIVDPQNPLTPRVLANRLWHYHFGTGIVDTPSDFGYMGGRPTHPELLDWLARQVHEHGWRLKPLHRLIVTSQTYRQSSAYRAEAAEIDAGSRYLWRFPPRRLSSEEIRDSMLAVAGQLDDTPGGPGFRLYRYLQDNVATYVPLDAPGPETYRRAIYHQNARASVVDLMTEFDCPDSAFGAPRRASTTTPLQALTLMNHSFTLDMARCLAERLRREAGDDSRAQVELAFRLAFSRPPAPDELDAALRLVEQHGLRAFGRALFNASELIYLD